MTNTTTPVESIGAPTGAASFYRWEVAGKPIAILFSLDLMDRLEREVLESFKAVTKRGSEIGGVLGGRVVAGSQPTVIVEQFEPVECDYSRGPLYLLSDEDKVRMKQALERVGRAGGGVSVAGFFRSNTRRELVLDEEDQAVAKEFFSDPNNVFLLVRPFAMKPSAGGFFFWEGGQLPEATYQQFPFKRAELVKSFSQFIVAASEAPVVREPLVMPKREERPAPPAALKREEPRPAPVVPPRREDPLPPPPPAMRREEPKREEPAPPPPPPVFKREEPKASPPRRDEAPPVGYRRDAPPVIRQREERPPIVPVTPRREERQSGPTLVSRREEQAAPPPVSRREERPTAPAVTAKREERPPVVVKRDEKPVVPPVVSRREEPAPAKPEERPVVAKPAEAVVVAPPPKREEPVKVEQVKAEPPKAEPVKVEQVKVEQVKVEPVKAAPPKATPVVAAPVERIPVAVAETAGPGLFSRFKWVIVALVVVLLAGGGYFVFVRSSGPAAPAKTADTLLGLKVETNAGQLLLSWNRAATIVSTATRATLTINDGDHKEDVDLDLATLHNGSIVYSPISNDVSFRLEVADQKTGKSEAGSVRRLAGRPSAAVAASAPQQAQPQTAKQTQAPNDQRPTQPAQAAPTPQQPPAPVVSAGPAVTKEPVRENSLASRLRAAEPAEIPAAPALESQPTQMAQNAPNVPGSVVAPPPPAPAQTRQTQAPAAQQRPSASAPAPATPVAPTRVGGQAQEAKVIKRFPAVYPLIARTSHIVGIVRVHVIIGKNGRVRKATATSGPQILRTSAVDSVMKWVYSPAILDGEPVEAEAQVDVNFQM